MRAPSWRYRTLLWLVSPWLLGYTLWRATRDGGTRYLWQRLGIHEPQPVTGQPLWLHAASVGEVLTAAPLIHRWLETQPESTVMVSTNTPTGRSVLLERFAPAHAERRLLHVYLPIDWPWAQKRFVQALRPRQVLIVETEIWPALYARCHQERIRLSIINARLSPRSMRLRGSWLGPDISRALQAARVLARSDPDAERYRQLGASNVHVVGDLKFADNRHSTQLSRPVESPYWLAASTHDNEECQLAEAWLAHERPGLLVIVPRHPERGPEIQAHLATLAALKAHPQWLAVPRSRQGVPAATHRLYLADTLGELQAWYKYAEAVFVGGSLVRRGGHNLLEPARLGKPIVTGMHTDNFQHIVQRLLAEKAIVVASDATAVVTALREADHQVGRVTARAQRAQAVALAATHVLDKYMALL